MTRPRYVEEDDQLRADRGREEALYVAFLRWWVLTWYDPSEFTHAYDAREQS